MSYLQAVILPGEYVVSNFSVSLPGRRYLFEQLGLALH